MIGRNKNWTGPSDWIKEFNKKHNPEFFYGENKTKAKKTQKKKADYTESTERHPIFKVED